MPLQVKGFPSRNKAPGLMLSTEQNQECWLVHTQNPRTVEAPAQTFQVLGYVKSLMLAGLQEPCLELTTHTPKKHEQKPSRRTQFSRHPWQVCL